MLTGGGDCPGLNAVIRAVARRSWAHGHEVIGVREGWRGMVEQLFEPLGRSQISGILPRGGTIVGTSRTNPYKLEGGVDAVRAAFEQIDALVTIGGERGVDEPVEDREARLARPAGQHEQHAARRVDVVGGADAEPKRAFATTGAVERHLERRAGVAGHAGAWRRVAQRRTTRVQEQREAQDEDRHAAILGGY